MFKKKSAVLIAGVLAASVVLAGCGESAAKTADAVEAEETAEEEAAAEEISDREDEVEETLDVEEVVEEEAPDEEVSEEYITYNVDDLSARQQDMLGPMDTIASCMTQNGPTDIGDSECVWTALYLMVVNYGDLLEDRIEYEGNELYVTEDVLFECASAMFADFNGTLPDGDMGNITKDGDRYCMPGSDRGDSYARISAWTDNPDGTCTVEIQELIESEQEVTQEYRLELTENRFGEENGYSLFAYSVASVEQTYQKEWNDSGEEADADEETSNDEYILPESDSRYYTEDELSSLTKDELRIARNEIYARHGRRFDSEDLQSYFDEKSWYQGTVDPSDFSMSVFNDYELANIRTIEDAEAQLANSAG